jgi:hypothetical protein
MAELAPVLQIRGLFFLRASLAGLAVSEDGCALTGDRCIARSTAQRAAICFANSESQRIYVISHNTRSAKCSRHLTELRTHYAKLLYLRQ